MRSSPTSGRRHCSFKVLAPAAVLLVTLFAYISLSRPQFLDASYIGFVPEEEKPITLAIIMPFAAVDVPKVVASLETWKDAPPCASGIGWGIEKPTFFFYSNKELNESDRNVIETTVEEMDVSLTCFKAFRFTFASIAKEDDHYNPDSRDSSWAAGPNEQFYQLLNDTGVIPSTVANIFMMEPDARPIRPSWVPHLYSVLKTSAPVWIRGSAFRGLCVSRKTNWANAGVDCHQLGTLSAHFNGNAFYSISDSKFREFLTEVRTSAFGKWPFDQAWLKYLDQDGMEKTKAELSNKFVFSELIRNYGGSPFNLTAVRQESPWTFFVHSDEIDQSLPEEAPSVDRATARTALSPALLTLLNQRASPTGDVMLSFTTGNYGDMASNFLYFLKKAGINNNIIVALDDEALAWATSINAPFFSYLLEGADSPLGNDAYGSDGFRNIVTRRAKLVGSLLRAGFNVLESDVDIVWLKNPFKALFNDKGPYELQIQSDSRLGFVEDDPRIRYPQFVNSGCYYARGTLRMADFLDLWANTMEGHPEWLEQKTLNTLLKENVMRVKFRILDPVLVPNGFVYFSRSVPQRANVEPVAIHNNWVDGTSVKLHRFRDAGLWAVDPPTYFDTSRRKFLAATLPALEDSSWSRVSNGLKAGVAIAEILNRTLILPRIHKYHDQPYTVTLDEYVDLKSFMGEVQDFRESNFAQKVFPDGPRLLFDINTGTSGRATQPDVPVVRFSPAAGHLGATDVELRKWFAPYADEPLIQLTDLFNRFHKVVDTATFPHLTKKLKNAFKSSDFVEQISGSTAGKLIVAANSVGKAKYTCAHIPRRQASGGKSVSEIINLLSPYLDSSDVVYVPSDLSASADFRQQFKAKFPFAYFREDFTELSKYFSEPELGMSMVVGAADQIICGWAIKFVGDVKTAFTSGICQLRESLGREKGDNVCKDIYGRPWLGSHL